MADVKWHPQNFVKTLTKNALDGVEEWAMVEWQPQAYEDAPKKTSTMAGSLGHERDDSAKCVYVGGGGRAKDYILKQELDRSLVHSVGKAGFIIDTVNSKKSSLPQYIKDHIES